MSRPRILHLIHHLRVGGAETLLVELLPRLAEAGFEVQIACLDDRGPLFYKLRERGIPGHFIGRRRGLDPAAVWRLARLLRSQRIDILNTHSFSAGFWGRIAAILARTPRVVTTMHTVAGWSQPVKQRLGNRMLRPATDRIVAVSESVQRSLIRQGMPRDAIQVIHNGICLERFRHQLSPVVAKERLGLESQGFCVGMVGRCSSEKGGDTWVRALAQLVHGQVAVRGLMVGDGPARENWQSLAAREGIASRIQFAGTQNDVVPWLAAMDVLVCPSVQESFGMAALEAQAAGIPVVATRIDGFGEVLHDGEDALLVPPGNPGALAEAIRDLLRSDSLATRLAAGGKLNASRFAITETARQYAALYRELSGGG